MFTVIRQLIRLYPPLLKQLLFLWVASLFAVSLDLVGISLVFPLFLILFGGVSSEADDGLFSTFSSLIRNVADHFSLSDQELLAYLALSIAVLLILKNLYILFIQYLQLRWVARTRSKVSTDIIRAALNMDFLKAATINRHVPSLLQTILPFCIERFMLHFLLGTSYAVMIICLGSVLVYYNFVFDLLIPVLIFFSIIISLQLIIRRFTRIVSNRFTEVHQDHLKEITSLLESFNEIKASDKQEFFIERYYKLINKTSNNGAQVIFFQNTPGVVTEISAVVLFVLLILTVADAGHDNYSSILAGFAVLAMGIFRMLPMLNRLFLSWNNIQMGIKSAHQIVDFVDNHVEDESKSSSLVHTYDSNFFKSVHSIEYDSIGFEYAPHKPIFHNESFSLKKGDMLAITGASGSGKSTLLYTILGFLCPVKGSIIVDGYVVDHQNYADFIAKNAGYVPQHPYLMHDTIRNNIAFGEHDHDINDDQVRHALKLAGLEEWIDHIDDIIEDNGKNISGGQRQRIAIARALYRKPSILILDEATSGLDYDNEVLIIDCLRSLSKECATMIVCVTHSDVLNRACNKKIHIKDGQFYKHI